MEYMDNHHVCRKSAVSNVTISPIRINGTFAYLVFVTTITAHTSDGNSLTAQSDFASVIRIKGSPSAKYKVETTFWKIYSFSQLVNNLFHAYI